MAAAHSFGRYRVTKPLGAGAMGEVYEAVDDVLGREVAVKTIKAKHLDDRFRQEARAIAQLSHPGVVQVFDIDLASDPPYLVMERVAGPSLSERLEDGPLPIGDVITLGIQIARALAAAHAAGIVHRDVKPANILGAGHGTWKLADFGVAHVPDSSLTITGQFVGSPAYASPEALVKGEAAPAGDVFGLGATLYQAITGKWPRLEAKGAVLAPVPPLASTATNLPVKLAAAIDRACAFEADQRPTADELASLLAHATTLDPPPAVARSWKPFAIGGGVLALIVLVIASRGGSSKPAALAPAFAPEQDPPSEIHVQRPEGVDRRAAHDYDKVIHELEHHHYEGARRKLDEWERKWGSTPETEDLRRQIESIPDEPRHGDDD